jgi:hypothetical protein
MRLHAATAACVLTFSALPAAAQVPSYPWPAAPYAAPSIAAEEDGPRVRAGFGVGSGFGFMNPAVHSWGPDCIPVAVQGRVGAQFDHVFGLVYANTTHFLVCGGEGGFGVANWNTVMATFTLRHWFELGIGPSFDYYAVGLDGGSVQGFGLGLNQRIAFLIGGRPRSGPRRRGFQIGIDVHEDYVTDRSLPVILLGQLGADWY